MAQRTLLIIAPTLYQCCKTAEHWGFTLGQIDNFRNVTRAIGLRGVSAGTPFLTFGREHWCDHPHGFNLDQAVETLQRIGKLRIAQDDDIAAHRSYGAVPFRTKTAATLHEMTSKYAGVRL